MLTPQTYTSVHSQVNEETDEQTILVRVAFPLNTPVSPFGPSYLINLANIVGGSLYTKYEEDSGPVHDFIPQLAADLPEIDNNGRRYTVQLKEELMFSNGEPLTAEDVVFSYNLYLTPLINPNRYSLISSVLEFNSSVSPLDDYTIQFDFKEVDIYNFEILSSYPILDKSEQAVLQFNSCISGNLGDCVFNYNETQFIGSGPYVINSHDLEEETLELVKNENYYDREVWADRITFEGSQGVRPYPPYLFPEDALADHQADIVLIRFNFALLEELEQPHPYVIQRMKHSYVFSMTFNFLHPIFGTGEAIPTGPNIETDNNEVQALHVRKAFFYLMDREYMAEVLWGGAGIPTGSLIPSNAVGYNASLDTYEFSLEKARMHLELAGFDYSTLVDANQDGDYNDTGDTHFFNFTVMPYGGPNDKRGQFAEYTANHFRRVGINLVPIPTNDSSTWSFNDDGLINLRHNNTGFDTGMWTYPFTQPFSTEFVFSSRGRCDVPGQYQCFNRGGYQNPLVDTLVDQFEGSGNFSLRFEVLNDLQSILSEDLPAIPINFANSPVPKKHDFIMPDVKYGDSHLIRWELARKEGWTSPISGDTDPKSNGESSNVLLIGGIATAVIIALVLVRRKIV